MPVGTETSILGRSGNRFMQTINVWRLPAVAAAGGKPSADSRAVRLGPS
jgi:hypothetical protein